VSRELFSLMTLAMRGGARTTDRVLVLSEEVREPSSLSFPYFDQPAVVRPAALAESAAHSSPAWSGATIGEPPFDLVLLDLDADRSAARVTGALRFLREDGSLVLFDRVQSLTSTLRDAPWALGFSGRATPLPATIEAILARHGLTQQSALIADPSLHRLHYLIGAAGRSEIPGLPAGPFKRWLLGGQAFYLQPRQKAVIAHSKARATLIESAMRSVGGSRSGDAGSTSDVRQCLLSGTNVLMFKVAEPQRGTVFFRFPLEPRSAERASDHHAMLVHLDERGYGLAPKPVHQGHAGGFPFFAEAAVSGVNVSPALPGMRHPELRAHFDAALEAIEALHRVGGETRALTGARFDRYIGTRIEGLRLCLRDRGADEGVCATLAETMRQETEGHQVIIGLCHGDAKLANCLFQSSRVSGVIDWDLSARDGLCFVDIAALLASTLLHRNGRSPSRLLGGESPDYRVLSPAVATYCERTGTTPFSYRATILLYWLDRVARHHTFERVTDAWFGRYVQPMLLELGGRPSRA
jgi:aminoglycoside phosphotransferase (APT) family kinase protein